MSKLYIKLGVISIEMLPNTLMSTKNDTKGSGKE